MEERQLRRRTEFYKSYMKRVTFKLLPFNNVMSIVKMLKNLKDDQQQKRRKSYRKAKPFNLSKSK